MCCKLCSNNGTILSYSISRLTVKLAVHLPMHLKQDMLDNVSFKAHRLLMLSSQRQQLNVVNVFYYIQIDAIDPGTKINKSHSIVLL